MSTINIVIEELKKKLNVKELNEYDNIDINIVKELLKEDNMYLLDEYVDKINTPFALAWYYDNWNSHSKYVPLIEKDLNSFLNKDLVIFTIYNNFSFKIRIDKKTKIDEGKQSLIIKAYINENKEKTEINYKIIGPEGWGWNITKQQLKALTESNIIINENNIIKKSNFWNKLFKFINFKK